MAHANAAIVQNPRPNNNTVLHGDALEQIKKLAPPLSYNNTNPASPPTSNFRRDTASSQNQTTASYGNFTNQAYTIPPEVVEAARLVAEATPPNHFKNSDAERLARIRAIASTKNNDTNVMPQKMKHPSGLVSYVNPSELPLIIQNGTEVPGLGNLSTLAKRDSQSYWQETIPQLGESPFAPAGYKVWRNVKDYGAKGDGVTDDTAAIQKAISDGNRCGAGCSSSSIYPATVYFPSGTYLVSSSIIQYYNTELLGNPITPPTIVAAASFVGLGVISSDVYSGPTTEWYLNTNNFLRSIRNFEIDIRATPQNGQVCGIHWQVAQGSSLENIAFWQSDPGTYPETTQQGIYMENGSGGFLGNLIFLGGKFGAFMGNQQFTASGLYFSGCQTGLQISWDWGWTMQNLFFDNCQTGVTVVGGAGGPMSTGQGVGSLILTDVEMYDTVVAVDTSLFADNSTAFLLQNGQFNNVSTIVLDSDSKVVLYPGASGESVLVDSWGFGRVTDATGETGFENGASISTPNRTASLTDPDNKAAQQYFFTRRRPSYSDLGNSQLIDVKAWGAKGDGVSDDTVTLNYIFDAAANISAVVYIPFGVYVVTDTLYVPPGSRIIGQAWAQIMATGPVFGDMSNPRAVVQVGDQGSVGVVEIQCIMVTVKGPTAGAVLMEWNIHESTQGSAGLWDSHFRVGGADGTGLQAKDCPTTSKSSQCNAASLIMHITQTASAYLENVWMWVADHDMDDPNQTQINVFVGRGLLVESQGPTWLWGTSAEHSVLYNYGISSAKNLVMGLVQTEAPYFQPSLAEAPAPFTDSLVFANDPTFASCASSGASNCKMSWSIRIVDSSTIYILSTGLYTWFQDYDQTCVNDGQNNCQMSTFYVEQSYDLWIYNLITIGSEEMISPLNGNPIIAKDNRNGFASSILAWFGGANQTTGARNFTGYQLYTLDNLTNTNFPDICKTSLTANIDCADYTNMWTQPSYHGSIDNATLQQLVCAPGCGESLAAWYNGVNTNCAGQTWASGAPTALYGGYIWYGYNETCEKDPATGEYCNEVIANFTDQESIDTIPAAELCSECFLGRLQMMQQSPYSIFNVFTWYQMALQAAVSVCSLGNTPTSPQAPFIPPVAAPQFCVSGQYYTTQAGDSCDSIALSHSVSSASIFFGNGNITNCTSLPAGQDLCVPLTCQTYALRSDDNCLSASVNAGVPDITLYNTWINSGCDNIHEANVTLGSVLCSSPMGGTYIPGTPTNTSMFPGSDRTGYGTTLVPPPEGSKTAPNTTLMCGGWYTVSEGDVCANLTLNYAIPLNLFSVANPSVNVSDCTASLIAGDSYCVAPLRPGTATISYTWEPLGCWNNTDPSSSVLTETGFSNQTSMTVERCGNACIEANYPFFGLSGEDCVCGSQVAINSVQVDSGQCMLACPGNSSESCGGSNGITELYGPPGEPLSFHYADLGCYPDSSTQRALGGGTSLLAQTNNTVQGCASYCLPKYPYFGVEDGGDCWCGETFNSALTVLDPKSCNTNCTGSELEPCGGLSAIEVFAVKTSVTVSPLVTASSTSNAPTTSTSAI